MVAIDATVLKPGLFVDDVRVHELLVRFCEIHDAFDYPDDARDKNKRDADPAGYEGNDPRRKRHTQQNKAFCLISEYEFMHTKRAEQNSAQPGREFLIGTGGLWPGIRHLLHWCRSCG